ncbi:MAG: apple domain-containing protein [Rhizobiales bacterium]|nr:apple domain-containing protein [Hyphomicrobiales bacterium]
MRHWLIPTTFLLVAGICTLLAPAWAQLGFDRPGGDYSTVTIRSGDPAACAARCERDSRCRGWTFSYPRTERTAATCWLKSRVTPRVENDCCVSGVRGASIEEPEIGDLEYAIDRYGGDYRNFETPPHPQGQLCAKACEADKRCRAWTYARPGYVGSAARCFLKNRITRPRPRPCCISGVVR